MRHFALRGADDTVSNERAGRIYVQTIYYTADAYGAKTWTPGDTQYILDARTGQVLWQLTVLTVKAQIAEEIDRHSGEVVFLQGDDTTHSMLSILDGRTGVLEAHVRLPYKASSVRVSARLG